MHVYVSPKAFELDSATGDFCCTDAGELLALWTCPCSNPDCPKETFTGLESHCSTRLGVVVDRPDVDRSVLLKLFRSDLVKRGWYDGSGDEETEEWLADMVADVKRTAEQFGVGTTVRYDGAFWSVNSRLSLVK